MYVITLIILQKLCKICHFNFLILRFIIDLKLRSPPLALPVTMVRRPHVNTGLEMKEKLAFCSRQLNMLRNIYCRLLNPLKSRGNYMYHPL
jgi:hypothetical protein